MTDTVDLLDTLDGVTTGTYLVDTSSGSRYIIDLDGKTLTRAINQVDVAPGYELLTGDLRRDGDAVPLYRVGRCTVGERGLFGIRELDLHDGYVGTTRDTTPVVKIVRL